MTVGSDPALLVLHGVRVLGGPSVGAIAERFSLPAAEVREHLLDAQAFGWASRHDFFGETWSLTDSGRAQDERLLAAELDATGARATVTAVHAAFLPVNRRHGQACTDWQLRRLGHERRIANDHSDPVWDDRVLAELEACDDALADLCATLTGALVRFAAYAPLHSAALGRVRQGEHAWLDAPDRPSCQLVWIQFHEDLLASLGIPRGTDG
jgi:hypothetical protein